ncbi:MAG: PAS domain-containing protein [Alphaproteobacteria bacterium]|nr:PAS domain-containing protein [Alphaproteobacteria bacterium]
MTKDRKSLTGQERFFDKDDIIVSKTDLRGRILYANRTFMKIGIFEEKTLLGQPHNILRHPDMPRCIFKLLWDQIGSGQEVFAYVLNRASNGDHYWVLAHVTPSYDGSGNITGYHSNRRVPNRKILDETIIPMYKSLCEIENKSYNSKDAMQKSYEHLLTILAEKGSNYDEFIFSLQS